MVKLTVSVYRFFKEHKAAFWGILVCSTLFFAFFASKITFEEDISKLLPSTQKGGAEDLVFSNLKVKDKIFLQFHSPTGEATPDELMEACDAFAQSLLEGDSATQAIDNILYQLDEEVFTNAIAFLYECAPMYLDSADYAGLDTLLTPAHAARQMAENYALLRSPAGSAFRSMVVQDPIGLRNLFLAGQGDLANGLGGNYKLYQNHFFTPDTTVALAFLSPNFASFDSGKGTSLTSMIESRIAQFRTEYPDIEVLYHGAPVQSAYNSKRIKTDLLLTISVSLVLIIALLLVCFRNKSNIVFLIVPVVYGVLFALAIVYLIKGSMSLMALGIGAIVMGVAFSYCLHVITHFKYVNDAEAVLKDETNAVLNGMLTTIGAFMGLLLTQSELLRDFGLFASLGLVGTTAFSLLFLPQFFNPRNNRKSDKAFRLLERINSYPYHRKRWLIATIVAVSAVCFVMSGRVQFDPDLQHIGYNDPDVQRSKELLAAKTTGSRSTVYFAAVAQQLDSALCYAGQLTDRLDALKLAGQVQGYAAPFHLFIPTGEQEERIARWKAYWTPARIADARRTVTDAGRQYRFSERTFEPFFRMLEADYEPVSLYEAGVIPQGLLDNIIESNGQQYLVFVPVQMDRARLAEVGDAVTGTGRHFLVIDPMYYTNDMVRTVHDDFNVTLTISSVFVLIVLLLSYRSLIMALIAFLPMSLSWYIVTGCMAIFGIEFNLINIVISTFVFGIGVDYSIFITDGLLAVYRTRKPLLLHHKTAIFLSAVILVIVVVSLLFAVHPAISSIGVSTLIGMGGTIVIAYTLLPALFDWLVTGRIRRGKSPVSVFNLFIPNKKETPARRIKNNYLYKGNAVELTLRRELARTRDYTLLNVLMRDCHSLLDYGCEYGFCCYWTVAAGKEMEITGIDEKAYRIALADNCYQKTPSMRFTTCADDVADQYDLVIINRDEPLMPPERLAALLGHARTVMVRKDIAPRYVPLLDAKRFKVRTEDKVFEAYSVL